ncbi:transmembrane protein 267 [Ostrinia furnacalis]|uniref:transmembrane protein 267 n=1 Tax=Ostrinia furnacalis TaxID=93504 RepID=UPI00103E95C5|nr:transmembrane protein 267 [Ostrinia furnacalis]
MKFLNAFLTICLFSTALLGDYIVFKSKYSNSFIFRAIADSTVHAGVGLFSSLLFFSRGQSILSNTCIYNVILCTIVSSLIDVDHFIVAKSINLKDLTNLKQRGIFHCTTFWVVLTALLLALSRIFKHANAYTTTWMLIVAFTSHHIRDANRRGLWCYPFGHTPPISTHVYVILLGTLPYLFSVMYNFMKPVLVEKPIDYTLLI